MELLESALRASGGLDLWRLTRRFTVHMSISGALPATRCSSAKLNELVVEGGTHAQELDIIGFARPELCALYRRDWVALEGQDAVQIMERRATPAEFLKGLQSESWDPLQLAYYCGYLIWNYMATPFILAEQDFTRSGSRRIRVLGERLQRLEVKFPARVVSHAATQVFYFDSNWLLKRLDYPAAHRAQGNVAQMFSGYQRFSGFTIPTLCRLLTLGSDGMPIANPTLLDLEIFDVSFA